MKLSIEIKYHFDFTKAEIDSLLETFDDMHNGNPYNATILYQIEDAIIDSQKTTKP